MEEISLKLLLLFHRLEISQCHEYLKEETNLKENLTQRPASDFRC